MATTNQIPSALPTPQGGKVIIGGFDGHGSTSAVAYARENNIPLSDIYIKYPDCSPELLPKYLYSLNLFGKDITVVDIAINNKNPAEWINIMSLIAQNNQLTFYDHHGTNLQYLKTLPPNIKFLQFSDTISMARALVQNPENFNIALVGSVTDRDPSVKNMLSDRELQKFIDIANAYDTIIRSNLSTAVQNLYNSGFAYLESLPSQVQYPPASLARQIPLVKQSNGVALVDITQVQLQQWLWKSIDEYLRVNGFDYLVAIGQTTDRQINSVVPIVIVAKYWLSDLPAPKPIVSGIIQGRKTYGHDNGFSISVTDINDARTLADTIFNALVSQWSSTARALGSGVVANAVQNDFRNILSKLTEILEEQRKMYGEYLKLKQQQVELLKNAGEQDRRRYD